MSKMQLRLTGSGGQGVILASVILSEAAIIAGKYTAQSQSYGPEARGGSCKAECIISDDEINFTKVTSTTFLMALTQKSLDEYTVNLPESTVILMDSSLEFPEKNKKNRVIILPILKTAKEKVGKSVTANIVAVGAINKILGIVNRKQIREAVLLHVPTGTEAINMAALDAGEEIAASALI